MTTQTAVYFEVKDRLTAQGVIALDGPAKDLPRDESGLVAQCVVLYPSAGLPRVTRMSTAMSGRDDAVTLICVGATPLDAAAVAGRVQVALNGCRLPSGGMLIPSFLPPPPTPEPNADPQRASLPLEYSTITKG